MIRERAVTQVISVVQEKGGAGKTTLLITLASLMVADGARVAVIDTDPQHNLEDWAKKEETDLDWIFEDNDEKLIPTIRALKKASPAYDVILVDTAGFKSAMAVYAINAAGLVLDKRGTIPFHVNCRQLFLRLMNPGNPQHRGNWIVLPCM